MSEKKMTIEMVPEGQSPPAEKQKRKGLPAAGEPWSPVKHDPVVMGRVARALEGVPPNVVRRLREYIAAVVETAGQEPVHSQLVNGPWNPQSRSYDAQLNVAGQNQLKNAD